ncbi:ParB/RepB/Spo0J family partition protein [Desulfurivibrio alkaliphilus]|uniref:ParB domain protein nuclease n=1 Tax=Desulfurivibrio alkaliphilus (strain DSM 19089 / UNIQEM U267 / AHT2) TaxID=589865 RepID=D6Z1L9_DESAT|nr:ParB N-terminal domain-containing protein [Desulfurivibrio alkaliphilus]ADH85444.1 ParB domain protein nuclease [Desulfurivibrio alkaliphilus AHT 2]
MIAQGQIQRVLATQLDFADLSWRFSPIPVEEPDEALAVSIQRVGLLHPPIVYPRGDVYQLLSGQRRAWLAVRRFNCTALPCLVLPPAIGDDELLVLAHEAIACKRAPTVVELALFGRKVLELLAEEQLPALLSRLSGPAMTPFQLKRWAELAELEEPFAVALHQGRLQEPVAREMLTMSLPERLTIFELIELLQLSAGNQRKLTEICRELSRRRRVSIRQILAGEEIREILDHPEMNAPQQTAALMRHLTACRYPELTAAEQEFNTWQARLRLPDGWSVAPTRSFEDDQVTLTLPLANREILQQCLPRLQAALASENNF